MVRALIVPAALQTTLRMPMLFQRWWCGRNSGSAAQPEQLLHKLPHAKRVQKTPSVTEAISSVTVTLQSFKKLSFATETLLHILLSSNANALASGCYFWQKSWFSGDTTATPKDATPSQDVPRLGTSSPQVLMALKTLGRQAKSVKYH